MVSENDAVPAKQPTPVKQTRVRKPVNDNVVDISKLQQALHRLEAELLEKDQVIEVLQKQNQQLKQDLEATRVLKRLVLSGAIDQLTAMTQLLKLEVTRRD